MSKTTKSGRRASFRAYFDPGCDPRWSTQQQTEWRNGIRRRASVAAREADLRNSIARSFVRAGAMMFAGWAADRAMGAR